MKSYIQRSYSWIASRPSDAAPEDVILYAPGALRIAILMFLVVGSAVSIPYLVEHFTDTRLFIVRLLVIALTAVGALLTFKYAGRRYKAWVLVTTLLGMSATLFFITYAEGPNINPHSAILVTYVIGAGLCLGRRGVIVSSAWLLLNYLLLNMLAGSDLWPHPTSVPIEKIQHENLSVVFFLLLILVPLLLGYMAKVERYVSSLKRASDEQNRLLQQVIAVREEERRRIAHVLHDGAVQNLGALRLAVLSDASKDDVLDVADTVLRQVRTLSSDLHPAVLDLCGLPAALEQLADQHEEASSILVQVSVPEDEALSSETRIVLFRIAQEALNNIRKHSCAHRAWLKLEMKNDGVILEVRDDGKGFDVEPARRQAVEHRHLGLATLHELALSVHGTLQLASQLGHGTTITVFVPLADAASHTSSNQTNMSYTDQESRVSYEHSRLAS